MAVSAVIDCKRFSHLHRLLTITALVLRFTRKLMFKGREPGLVPVDITAEDIVEAEELWIRDILWNFGLETVSYTHLTLPTICSV